MSAPREVRTPLSGPLEVAAGIVSARSMPIVGRHAASLGRQAVPRGAHRSIDAIARDAGFGDRSHFNRVFRRRYGAAPSDVRSMAYEEKAHAYNSDPFQPQNLKAGRAYELWS